ncbi:MAG: hypothetical protein DMG11_27690 [Acidobacteria bacterium]|nr:MAG: hypothetical protein DMG11_27690 [Acidobacteriota bacterium]
MDEAGPRSLQGSGRGARRAVRRLSSVSRPCGQWTSDPQREHRRPRGARGRIRRLQHFIARQACAGSGFLRQLCAELARAIGGNLRADVDPLNNTNFQTENLFGVWVSQGLTDPEHNTPYILQGGLGMPDRDYYISTSPQMVELRNQYKNIAECIPLLAKEGWLRHQ